MSFGNVTRVVVVLAGCVAAVGSSTSSSNQSTSGTPQYGQGQNGPPPSQQMDPSRALGLWKSSFGAVKIEADDSKGGLQAGAVQGVWVYTRQGQEVVGYFSGNLHGNVLQFRWQEPNNPPLVGEGYLVFDLQGRQYSGRWWSERRDRVGDWNGWRQASQARRSDYADPNDPQDNTYGPQPPPRGYAPQPRAQPGYPGGYPEGYPPPTAPQPRPRQPAPQPQPGPEPTYY
jgi:hypothetical protein